eukprot:TRINITY_DN11568_c0_g1_i4.p1 TRINITY_DN11568_c0_g1~~TRINITY_DN11568_c0_g1_i4.p1  ORF type:complete len:512 (+),score=86.63 TRINITY_DN11568_c0_g1_i4:39-1574(+)
MSAVVPRHLRAVSSSQWVPPPEHGPVCKDCPNIIFSLTDDQDTLLGGWEPMRHTKRLLQNSGALLTEWRIHTPICSPSRSESISGRYFHNIKSDLAVPPMKVNPAASAHINSSLYINQSFGVYLRQLRGYQTGIFGKANFNTMEGFDRWFQGAFLGYGGVWEDNESPDFQYHASKDEYATSLLGNKSIEWLSRDNVTGKTSDDRPFFLYFAPHCPHIPATPAKWYENECKGTAAPRTPNYNYSDPSFHELVSRQPPLNQTEADDIDQLARLRCQCLLSVDDAHLALYEKLEELGQLNKSTYNLGNHRLPSNKFLLYDHSLRIPGVVTGPGVEPGSENSVFGTNVDYTPTWLGLADIDTPAHMDGKSLVPNLVTADSANLPGSVRRHLAKTKLANRTEQFVQYYNQGPWQPNDAKDGLNRVLDDYSNTYIGLHIKDPNFGHYKYGEYEYVCTTENILAKNCFPEPDWYELFDLDQDPFELTNIYHQVDDDVQKELHRRLMQWYPCSGQGECL